MHGVSLRSHEQAEWISFLIQHFHPCLLARPSSSLLPLLSQPWVSWHVTTSCWSLEWCEILTGMKTLLQSVIIGKTPQGSFKVWLVHIGVFNVWLISVVHYWSTWTTAVFHRLQNISCSVSDIQPQIIRLSWGFKDEKLEHFEIIEVIGLEDFTQVI